MALKNSGFEGHYTTRGAPEVQVAPEWEPFWLEGTPHDGDGPCVRPEFKPITRNVDAHRVVDGDTAQVWFVRWNTMDAGVYQRMIGLPAGQTLEFSANVQVWCSEQNDPRADDGELYMRVGIDPTGGEDPWSGSVIWSEWTRGTRDYQVLSVSAVAQGTAATVFIRGWNKWKLSHNDAYVDGAELSAGDGNGGGGGSTGELADISAKLAHIGSVLERIADRLDKMS